MISIKRDYYVSRSGVSQIHFGHRYKPLSYQLGDICERCWLDVPLRPGDVGWSMDHDEAIRPVGRDGCPHGSAA